MRLQISWRYLVAFVCLIMLCGLGHEFAHHIVGAIFCGAFGTKTFNSFELASQCRNLPLAFVLANWAGPLFTYSLLWLGWQRLVSPDPGKRQLGFALIFANFPINRLFFALLGWNDEEYVTRTIYGEGTWGYGLTNLAIWVMAIPPLVAAWQALEPRRRLPFYLAFFFLPFAFVIGIGIVMEDWLLLRMHFMDQTVYGVPALLIATELVCLWLYFTFRDAITGTPDVEVGNFGPGATMGPSRQSGKIPLPR